MSNTAKLHAALDQFPAKDDDYEVKVSLAVINYPKNSHGLDMHLCSMMMREILINIAMSVIDQTVFLKFLLLSYYYMQTSISMPKVQLKGLFYVYGVWW